MASTRLPLLLALVVGSCADDGAPVDDPGGGDLPLGDRTAADSKADGIWGAALDCKPIPSLPTLVSPRITVSLQGLTLHLTDPASGFDKVFPIGPGRIDLTPTDPEFGESLSYAPVIRAGSGDFSITPASSVACKTWWTDPDTGAKSPVFAGLPFMSWSGAYAIHGPIDNYRAANGGALRRGFVSHGCIRMEAADVLEVYARIRGLAKVPVHVQREPERTVDQTTIDLPSRWLGSACAQSADCNFPDGFCAKNRYSQRGFCSARCSQYCADRAGAPGSFCVADPDAPGQGMCLPKVQSENFECRPYDHLVSAVQARFNHPATTAAVCAPGSPGWIGDHCFASTDCKNGTTCRGATTLAPGLCSLPCTQFCADQPGWADTFCAAAPALAAGGSCVRQCTPSSNASECPGHTTCVATARFGQPAIRRPVCVPASGGTL